jgi:hypothetical protein
MDKNYDMWNRVKVIPFESKFKPFVCDTCKTATQNIDLDLGIFICEKCSSKDSQKDLLEDDWNEIINNPSKKEFQGGFMLSSQSGRKNKK